MMKTLLVGVVAAVLAWSFTYLLMRDQVPTVVAFLEHEVVRLDANMQRMEDRLNVLPQCWQLDEPAHEGGG